METLVDWKKSFALDVENKWQLMNDEYNNYLSTSNVGYLQQACGKMFSIVENFLQLKYLYRISNYGELKALVKNNKNDYELLLESAQLHYFYYNGEVHMQKDEAEFFYKKVYGKMKLRLKKGK